MQYRCVLNHYVLFWGNYLHNMKTTYSNISCMYKSSPFHLTNRYKLNIFVSHTKKYFEIQDYIKKIYPLYTNIKKRS